MSVLYRLLAKIRNLFRSRRADQELDREICAHLALMQDDFEREGMSEVEAGAASHRAYGNVAHIKELHREQRSLLWLEETFSDVRYAFRSFIRNKVFAGVAILTLALGIGANTAIFSIINVVLLHPLAYPDAGRLVALTAKNLGSGLTIVSFMKLEFLRQQTQTLEHVGAFYGLNLNVTSQGEPIVANGLHASRELLLALGVSPARGRIFLPAEDQPGGNEVAVVSDEFWRNHLGADPEIVGKPLAIDGHSVTVVGVLPSSFRFPFTAPEPDVWLPRVFENPAYTLDRIRAGAAYLVLIGKARPGQSVERVRAEVDAMCANFRQSFPNMPDSVAGLTVAPLESFLGANVRDSLLALLGAVGFVLLIACVNVANLLLARATSREKEIGIRRALGAGHGRLTRQFLTETLVLSLLGGGVGVLMAAIFLPPMLRSITPGTLPLSDLVHLDRLVLLFAVFLCCVCGMLFGLAPTLQALRVNLHDKLKEGARGSTGRGGLLRKFMIVSEVSLTLMLMTGAGLLIKSLTNLMHVSPGFVSTNVTAFPFSLPQAQYPKPGQRAEFYRRLLEDASTAPGIQSAALMSHLPLNGVARFIHICPEGTTCQGLSKDPLAVWLQVSPDFFKTTRLELISGRSFDERDRADSTPVVIICKAIADRYFSGTNPMGRHIVVSRDKVSMEIVGVAANIKFSALNGPNDEAVFVPYTQNPWPSTALLVRSASGASPVASVRQLVSHLDPNLPLSNIRSMDQIVSGSVAQPRLVAALVGAFAVSALFLAAVGIYGVMAYLVSQRSAEIAIRMALGAQRWSIFGLIVGQGMRLVAVGLAIGLVLSLTVTRLISTLLFGTSPTDLGTLVGVCVLFLFVALSACYIPSRRAMRLDAVQALRSM